MSGGGGGIIIIGDKPLNVLLLEYQSKVATWRRPQMLAILGAYEKNENSITRDMQQFLLRCAADVVDNG